VIGGDAGTAEGDFASALIWSSRPGQELPMLMIVTNNRFGISTPAQTQHGEKNIADRARAFGIECGVADGNHPEKIWKSLGSAMDFVRETGKPYLLEVEVSRIYGHSSSSGANRLKEELCPIETFSKKLIKQGWLEEDEVQRFWDSAWTEANAALDLARSEPYPDPSTVQHHTFANNEAAGVPGRGI
jgi:2-oxoisovalerate dehydrogenase E1 component alpha subunit